METGQTSSAMPGLHDLLEQAGVLDRADAVAEPAGVERVEAGPDVVGPAQLAAVRHQQQPGPVGDREGRAEVGRRAAPLVVGEPEADHAAAGVLGGQPGQGPGVERVAGAVGRDDQRDAEAGLARRLGHGVEHQVGEGGDPAEAGGVARRVDLDLQPPAPVADVVLGRLAHQPSYVALGAQHRPRDVVEPLEPEPALLVGRRELRRPLAHQRVGQVDAVALGELEQGVVPHGAGEVQMQVRLGQGREPPLASRCT